MFKKIYLALLLPFLVLGILLFKNNFITQQITEPTKKTATIKINEQENIYEITDNETAYSLLQKASGDIKIKQYDFGVFVESINGKPNTKDLTWIWYANGKPGQTASDKYLVQDKDLIEWKYEKPIF